MQDPLFIVLGLVLLIAGGNWLLKSAVELSLRLNISKIVIGMTVVSFATSAPELIVSVKSALAKFPDLALGNVVGSNIANLGLVLGITILLGSISVNKSFYTTDWPVMMIATGLFVGFIYFDGEIQQYEGVIMVVFLIAFLVYLLRFQKPLVEEESTEEEVLLPLYKTLLFLIIGGVSLWGGSELLVKGAVGVASSYGVSERVIGVTVISIGTSIPELAASIIAVIKKEKSIITPIKVVDQGLLSNDIFWMLGVSFLILPLVLIPKKLRLGLKEGVLLLGLYIFFVYTTVS